MAIEDWAEELTSVLEGVEGVAEVRQYDDLPGKIVASPTVVWMPTSGSQQYGLSSPAVAIHRVQVTLYIRAALLPEGVGKAVPFVALVRDAVAAAVQLSGTVNYILPAAEGPFYEGPAALSYGQGPDVFTGINLYFDVKEVEALTVAA